MLWHMQISESFNRFGVSESCQHLLVARFDAEPAQVKRSAHWHVLAQAMPHQCCTYCLTWAICAATSNYRACEGGAAALEQPTHCHGQSFDWEGELQACLESQPVCSDCGTTETS